MWGNLTTKAFFKGADWPALNLGYNPIKKIWNILTNSMYANGKQYASA